MIVTLNRLQVSVSDSHSVVNTILVGRYCIPKPMMFIIKAILLLLLLLSRQATEGDRMITFSRSRAQCRSSPINKTCNSRIDRKNELNV